MKQRKLIDIALGIIAALSVLVCVLYSATGGERHSVLLAAVVLSTLVGIVGLIALELRLRAHSRLWPAASAMACCFAIMLVTAATCWPLRAGYAWNRDSLDEAADRVRSGEHVDVPLRIGLFTIRKIEVSHDDFVCLWTHPDPIGNTGFMQCRSDHIPDRMWSEVSLDDHWQYVTED